MKINKYLPFAFIYFFFNTVGLPFGLTYMALLGPFFYYWVIIKRKKEVLLPFFAIFTPFIIMHIFVAGVDLKSYGFSLLNMLFVYIFCQAFFTFLKVCNDIDKIFRSILILNFIFCLAGMIILFTPYYELLWIEQTLTEGIFNFRRFKLLTYEASYYATLFTPVFFFFILQYVFRLNKIKSIWLIPMLIFPYILSFSIGVIASVMIAIIAVLFIYFKRLVQKKRIVNAIIYFFSITGAAMVILVMYFRHNPFFVRILNILSGSDSSTKGRTEEAYYLARRLLDEKNEFWGIGLGQVKLLGHDIIKSHYLYYWDFVATIPNAIAETLAIFGWLGLFLKISIEIIFFFFTRVWSNYYRLLLFIFIFIFQFAGSFITNLAEYVIWILAFTNVFPQFDVKSYRRPESELSMSSS